MLSISHRNHSSNFGFVMRNTGGFGEHVQIFPLQMSVKDQNQRTKMTGQMEPHALFYVYSTHAAV